MLISAVAILALCTTQFDPSVAVRDFKVETHSKNRPVDRLLTLMQNIYVSGANRVRLLLPQRARYEVSVEFEEGYIMGEIIERYRQVVVHTKNSIKYKGMKVYDKLIRLEFVQKLYFEIYHLVMMMHEIPRKFGISGEDLTSGIKGPANYNTSLIDAMNELPARAEEREREKRNQIRDLQAQKLELIKKGGTPSRVTRSKSRYWPIEYGWSIENW